MDSYDEIYMDLELELEAQIQSKNRDRRYKKEFASTIDAICTRVNPLDQRRTQILLIKNRDSFYLPNGFKSYENEKPELACIRGLNNLFSLS